MKRKYLIITIILLIIPFIRAFATSQVPDTLIYKGDTLLLFANPLEPLYKNGSIKPNFFGGKVGCGSTSCGRGYQAKWIMEGDYLYLIGIYSCCYGEDSIKANLKDVFGDKCVNGRVKADWFTGKITAPVGKLLYYIHSGYESLYEKDLEMEFANGKLLGTKEYDNSKSRLSEFSQDAEKSKNFIYSHIQWEYLPKLNNKSIKVAVKLSANENGKIDSVQIVRGYNDLFDNEAIRVVKSIPDWDIYYRHGVFKRVNWFLPIIFSEENRTKYGKNRHQ